jgi:hypothetical protein
MSEFTATAAAAQAAQAAPAPAASTIPAVPALVVSTSDHDLLIRVDTKLDVFMGQLADVHKRLSIVESRVDKAEGGVRAGIAVATFFGGLWGAIISTLVRFFVPR